MCMLVATQCKPGKYKFIIIKRYFIPVALLPNASSFVLLRSRKAMKNTFETAMKHATCMSVQRLTVVNAD